MQGVIHVRHSYPRVIGITRGVKHVTSSRKHRRVHITRKDICGVRRSSGYSVLNVDANGSLGTLLPVRLTRSTSDRLRSLFICGCLAHGLRAFHCGSRVVRPTQHVRAGPTHPGNPVVIYLSASKDVTNGPRGVTRSLLVGLLRVTSHRQQGYFLVTFSISVRPVSMEGRQTELLRFFSGATYKSASTAHVLRTAFHLLGRNGRCVGTSML